MNVLITGGAGFIGSHLCDALHRRGDDIWCLDNLTLGRKENVAHLQSSERFHFEIVDVLDSPRLKKVFEVTRFDAVFHLAANSDIPRGTTDPKVDLDATFYSTFSVLQQMAAHDVKKFFFASTSAVFGETSDRLHENYGPLRPISFYGAAKASAEAFTSVFVNHHQIQASVLRFPNVVGSRATHGALFDFIGRLKKDPAQLRVLGDGRQRKPYLWVEDLAEAILFVFDRAQPGLNVFHAGGEGTTAVSTMVAIVLEEMGLPNCKVIYSGNDRGWLGDVPFVNYDVGKLNRLGWKARYTSDEAVRVSVRQLLGK